MNKEKEEIEIELKEAERDITEIKPEFPLEKPKEEILEKPKEEMKVEAVTKVNELLLQTGFKTVGSLLETWSGVPEANLTDDELLVLVEVWKPYAPSLPPIYLAVLTTLIIFGKKGIIIASARKKKLPPSETTGETK